MPHSRARHNLCQNSTHTTFLENDTMQMGPIPEPRNRAEWHDWWHSPPQGAKATWRARFGDSGKRYYRAFPEPKDWITRKQEVGMEAFVRLETSLLRRMRQSLWRDAGRLVFENFGHDNERKTVFVALDFEGGPSHGIAAFGIAVFSGEEADIPAANYGMDNWHRRRFLFGDSHHVARDELRQTITDCFNRIHEEYGSADLVLVGHAVHAELEALQSLDLRLEDLHLSGVVDTERLARELLGTTGTLANLLKKLGIDWPSHAMHCAGNDAYYTMRALLALLLMRHRGCSGACRDLVKQPWVAPKHKVKAKPAKDWDTYLDGGTESQFMAFL